FGKDYPCQAFFHQVQIQLRRNFEGCALPTAAGVFRNDFSQTTPPQISATVLGPVFYAALFVVVQQAEDVVLRKAVAAFQKVELDGEAEAADHATQLLHQLDGGFHRAAGGEQVVDQHHTLAGCDRILVNLQR